LLPNTLWANPGLDMGLVAVEQKGLTKPPIKP